MTTEQQIEPETLLPCPFCGHSDGYHERADYFSDYWVCNNCSARGPLVDAECAHYEEDGDEIMRARTLCAWNQRPLSSDSKQECVAPSQHSEAMREALRKYGRHLSDCDLYANSTRSCTCGLTAALCTTPAPRQHSELADEYRYARRLFEALLEKHYPESPAKALPDLIGVLTQIDNLTTGLTRQPPSDAMREALEQFVRCSYPVATELNPKGYDWCIPWLDEALVEAIHALTQGKPDAA